MVEITRQRRRSIFASFYYRLNPLARRRNLSRSNVFRCKDTGLVILVVSLAAILIYFPFVRLQKSIVSGSHEELVIGSQVTLPELKKARESLLQAKQHRIANLRKIDREKYTVRIMTWRRNKQLTAQIDHLSSCPNIAQIQVVWCDTVNSPPPILFNRTASETPVIVERHSKNSLNERFRVSSSTPTYGILSIDDDVVRPCEAIDAGFYRWTDHPDRIVGYDTRLHMISEKSMVNDEKLGTPRIDTNPEWKYGYLSSSQKRNEYSITLTRFCFIHRDYLDLYIKYAPARILQTVDEKFNCEDIGMSFFVSALTLGKLPLLADFWATIPMMIKLYSKNTISGNDEHQANRDHCIDKFSFLLGLKDGYASLERSEVDRFENWGSFKAEKVLIGSMFGIGTDVEHEHPPYEIQNTFTLARKKLAAKTFKWVQEAKNMESQVNLRLPFEDEKAALFHKMKITGLIEQKRGN